MEFFLFFGYILSFLTFLNAITLVPQYEWNSIEFKWESDSDEENARSTGEYIPHASLPVDVDQYIKPGSDGKNPTQIIFITVLRKKGVPATLTTISDEEGPNGPLLQPYPDWATNNNKNCSGLTNVHRIAITQCGHLWALDSGVVDEQQVCPPKITVFDLKTDTVLKEIEIPEQVVKGDLVNIIVQPLDDNCESTAAYIADVLGNALIIYDGQRFCRLTGPEFGPEPGANTFRVGNDTAQGSQGLVGLSLSPYFEESVTEQVVFFNALASYSMYYVNSGELLSYCTTGNRPNIIKVGDSLSSQSIAQVIDGNDVLYYSSISDTSLNCFNIDKEFSDDERVTLAKNSETLQWLSAIKVAPPQTQFGKLLVLSNRYQKFSTDTIDENDVNYRVLDYNSYIATYGTKCSEN